MARGDFAREVSYGYGYPTKTDLRLVVSADPPSRGELSKHAKRFGYAGVQDLVASLPAKKSSDELAAKSQVADIKEQARKRSKRRRNLEEEARLLLERKPDLLPMAVADALNISDRRARVLVDKIRGNAA